MHKKLNSPKWICLGMALAAFVSLATPKTASAQTLVLFENFENTTNFANTWTVESLYSEDDPTVWGVVSTGFGGATSMKPGTGTNMLYCVGTNNLGTRSSPYYPDNVGTTMSTQVDLTDYSNATLSFWFKYKIFLGNEENFFDEVMTDYMTVYIDDERVWGTDDFDVYAEPTDPAAVPVGWTLKTIDLTPYAGAVRTIRFDFESDFSGQEDGEGQGEGIYVDEILVNGSKADRPDFDKNGYPDLVWKHSSNGNISTWLMGDSGGGYDFSSAAMLPGRMAIGWNIAGQSDFNRDGSSDLLWQHSDGRLSIWFMTNSAFLRSAALTKRAALNWQVRGLADVNNDGHKDFIFQNLVDGRVSMWLMQGKTFAGAVASNAKIAKGSFIVAVNDFNYDGNEDLLVQRNSDGAFSLIYLSGANVRTTRSGEGFVRGSLAYPTPWRVKGAADVNGDGSIDLIVHNKNNLKTGVMYLNAFKYVQTVELRGGAASKLSWQIVGPK